MNGIRYCDLVGLDSPERVKDTSVQFNFCETGKLQIIALCETKRVRFELLRINSAKLCIFVSVRYVS